MRYAIAWSWTQNQEKPDRESQLQRTLAAATKQLLESLVTLVEGKYLEVPELVFIVAKQRAAVAGVGDRVAITTTTGRTLEHWIEEA